MGEIRFVGTGETRGYPYLVCKKRFVGTGETRGYPYLVCKKVNSRPEKRVEIKVSDSAVAIGTVGAGVGEGRHRILGVANGKWNPSLSFPCLMRF